MSTLVSKSSRVLLVVLAFLLMSCGGGGGGSDTPDPVALEDSAGLLASIGVTSIDDLKAKLAEKTPITLSLELTEADPTLKAETVVRLLKKNNSNIEYQKLKTNGIAEEVVAKLKELPLSPVGVKNLVRLPDTKIFPMPNLSQQAIDLYNAEKLKVLNRKLRLADQAALDSTQFQQLQVAFSKVEMVDNFGNLDQQFQNVLVKDSASGRPATANRSAVLDQLPGYHLGNYEMELNDTVDPALPLADSCLIISPELPMQVAQAGNEINSNLVTSASGNATVKLPHTGIALFAITSDNLVTVNLQTADGSSLVDQQVAGTYYLHVPVTAADVCQPYTFVGASNNYSIQLLDLKRSERLSQHFYYEGNEYVSAQSQIELVNSNAFFNAQSYNFSSINSLLDSVSILFNMESGSGGNTGFDVLIYSPSGKAYSATQYGITGFHTAQGFGAGITRENGVWRVDLLPAGSTQITLNKLTGISAKVASNNDSTRYLNVLAAVNTDNQVQTREFVLGMLNNVSLKTQGEDWSGDEGDVSLTLNTTMAPKLNVPSYLEDMLSSGETMNDQIALWQCWKKSEKTGSEFDAGQSCNEYRDEYERRKQLFESAHTYDWQNDPQYYQCRDENGDEAVCIKGEHGPYGIESPTQAYMAQMVMNDYSRTMDREYHDVEYLNVLSSYYDLYLNWKDRSVQSDTGSFPYDGLAYKTREVSACNEAVAGCELKGYQLGFYSPVIIETNRPVFGVPVDKVNESTLPIHFDYIAMDQDEYDEDAELFAVLSYAATQIYNVATGNFVGIVCDSIGLVDDLHQLELDAEDDPLGSARVSINRYSRSDPFYGLHNARNFNFFMSGLPEGNTEIDTFGQNLNYAQMACDVANLNATGLMFDAQSDNLLSMDDASLTEHSDLVQAITGIAGATNSPELAAQADAIASMLENGQLEEARQLMKLSTNVTSLTQGVDVYGDLQTLLTTFAEQGSAANGNNVIKSNAHYLLGDGHKKTRAEVEFLRVQSVPVAALSVTLDSVKIISNSEDDNDARIYLKPYVGLISDRDRGGLNTQSLFSDEDDSSDAPSGFLRFYHVADGQLLTPNARIFNTQSGQSNVAAIYVELAVTEDDGMSVEDDDMIGVFSQTFKLEEMFNANAQFKWDYLGGDEYQLVVSEYPVYSSRNQRTLENPLSDAYALQQQHNLNRSPSALVSFTIRVQTADLTVPYPLVDTSLQVTEVNAGKDTYSMNMNEINSVEIVDMDSPELFDVLNGLAIVTPGHDGMDGAVFHYDVETFAMSEMFRYDIKNFSGDLLPIQQAPTSSKAISPYVQDGLGQNRRLSLIKLLPDNRMLFVLSGDEGAKLMVVSFTDQGVMTLESSQNIIAADGSTVYSLMDATLSPDRTGLLVPYVPESYNSGDKTVAVYPKVLYYRLEGNDFIYQSTITNNSETITAAEFIREDAVSVSAKKLGYVTASSTVWNVMDPYIKSLHAACVSSSMNCWYEVMDRDILIYQIGESGQMTLMDTLNHYAAPIQYGSMSVNYYTSLHNHLFDNTGSAHAETLSATWSDAVLRYSKTLYQLYFDMNVNGFVSNGSSYLSPRKEILYNPVGQYYCAEGLSCAGYLQSANDANGNDPSTYVSPERVMDFDFADYDRDLILSISTQAADVDGNSCSLYTYVDVIGSNGLVGGTNFIRNTDCYRQNQLKLTSLYDGPAAFKGPQISGDIFDSEVTMDGSNDIAGMGFTFEVSDRDTRIDKLTLEVTAQHDPFDVTIKAPFYTHTPVYTASCETMPDGHGSCSGSIIPDYENASFKQTVTVSVSDGVYTSTRHFTLFLDREVPVLSDGVQNVQLATPEAYQLVNFTLDSSTSASSTNCGGSSYCYLIQNGFVDEWDWVNKPVWLNCVEETTSSYGSQRLQCTGQPPIGQAGSTMMQINAYQNKGTAYEKSASMMMTINVAEPDTQPNAFAFSTQSEVELDTLIESTPVTIYGLTGYASLSLDKGEYWRSSTGLWSSAAASNIVNGETIKLRLTSSTEYSTASTATLSIGGVTGSFTLNTKPDPAANDSTPDAFSFSPALDTALSSVIESSSITVTGITVSAAISVTNGEYQINSNGWVSVAGVVENGQSVALRHTSSDQYSSVVTTSLIIGGVSADFSSTTVALLAPQLSAASPITEPATNTFFEFTPTNSGGEVESWSINNKPAWASFDTVTGTISGTVEGFDSFNIEITATNSTGSDTFTATVNVQSNDSPYISSNYSCSLDDDFCDFSFSDDASWRASVDIITIGVQYGGDTPVVLSSPDDYELSEGNLRLHINATNNMVKQGGSYRISVSATGYTESSADLMLDGGTAVVGTLSVTPAFSAGQVSTISAPVTNRFGFAFSDAEVATQLLVKNLTPSLEEVYKARVTSVAAWETLSTAYYYADSNGDVSLQLRLPGCINIDDGFQLTMGTQSVQYLNTAGDCVDVDWINREAYTELLSIAQDSAGNSYQVYSSTTDFAGIAHVGDSYFNDLYLVKLDRNGERKWVRAIATLSFESLSSLIVYNDEIYIAGTVGLDGDIDDAGSEVALGMNDQFVVKYNGDGERLWSRQFGTALNDTVIKMAIHNDLLHLISKAGFNNGDATSSLNTVMYTLALDGTSLQTVMDSSTGSELIDNVPGIYSFMQIDAHGNYYLVAGNDVYKYSSSGVLIDQIIPLTKNIDAMVLTDNEVCVSSDSSDGNGVEVAKVSCFNNFDLALRWEKLIESNAPYTHEANKTARLAARDNVVYALVSSGAEIYYDASLIETPNQTLNLIAFNADDGTELNHKSWITEVRSDAMVQGDVISIDANGNIYLKGLVIHSFDSTFQIGYISYPGGYVQYPQNVFLMKTSLAATATPVPLSGVTRGEYSMVVTDHDHALQWIDNNGDYNNAKVWADANAACEAEEWAGYTDWRLATDVELSRALPYTPQENTGFRFYLYVDDYYYLWSNVESSAGWHMAIKPQGALGDAFDDTEWLNFRCVRYMP